MSHAFAHMCILSDTVFWRSIISDQEQHESPLPATPVPWTIDIYIQYDTVVANSIFQAGFLETKQSIMTSEFYRISKLCKKFTFGTCELNPGEDDVPLNSKMYGKLLETAAKAGPTLSFSEVHVIASFSISIETDTAIVRNLNLIMFDGEMPPWIAWILYCSKCSRRNETMAAFRWHRHGQQMVQRMQGTVLGSSHEPWKGYAAWQDSTMLRCIFEVLNWFVNKCMCLCICV